MDEDRSSVIIGAIRAMVEIQFSIAGQPITLRPYFYFDDRGGRHSVKGMHAELGLWLRFSVADIADLSVTDRRFAADSNFREHLPEDGHVQVSV